MRCEGLRGTCMMNRRIVNDITDFIFVEDQLEKADAIFIPGGSYPELPERAAELWKEGYAPYVVPSGRYSITKGEFAGVKSKAEKYGKAYATECGFYTDVLRTNGVDSSCIFQEEEAQFTAENARFTRRLLEAKGLHPRKAILCCKGFHSRRCLMYYQFSFPDTEFMIAPVCVNVTRENWHLTALGQEKVLGELTRLGTQFGPEWESLRRGNAATAPESQCAHPTIPQMLRF